jgi:hypothetical protein
LGQSEHIEGQPSQGHAVPQDPFGEYRQYYLALGPEFHADMSLLDYCSIRYRNRPREAQRGNAQTQNMDFIKKVGKLNIPTFNRSSRCSTRAWVQNLDTYLKLISMTESEAIIFATLHLDGEAHEWWYHGLVILGHSHITSYLEFMERLIERFDRRDSELHFMDLTQMTQASLVEAFITEFQWKEVVVLDISKHILVMLFTEVLIEPLRGLVKYLKTYTLQESIVRTRDMGDLLEINGCACLTIENIEILSPNHRPKPPPSTLTLTENDFGRKSIDNQGKCIKITKTDQKVQP